MARPPKNHIHDPYYQMRDFFVDESMRRITPKNPYNIIWLLDNYFKNDSSYVKNICLESIKLNKSVDTNLLSSEFKNKLLDDEVVLKRVRELKDNYNVDIDTIAVKVIRMKSPDLVKGLLAMGMDPNYIEEGRAPLHISLGRKSHKIAELYWNHSKTNRFIENEFGENIAFQAIDCRAWKFLEKIVKEEPTLILGTNLQGENIFDRLAKINNQTTLFDSTNVEKSYKKVPDRMKQIFIDMVNFLHENNVHVSANHRNKDIKDLITNVNYERLVNSLEVVSNTKKETRIKI